MASTTRSALCARRVRTRTAASAAPRQTPFPDDWRSSSLCAVSSRRPPISSPSRFPPPASSSLSSSARSSRERSISRHLRRRLTAIPRARSLPRSSGSSTGSPDLGSSCPRTRADPERKGHVGWRSSVADPDRSDLTNALPTSSSRGTRRRRRALCGTFLASSYRAPGIRPHHDDDREGGGSSGRSPLRVRARKKWWAFATAPPRPGPTAITIARGEGWVSRCSDPPGRRSRG